MLSPMFGKKCPKCGGKLKRKHEYICAGVASDWKCTKCGRRFTDSEV